MKSVPQHFKESTDAPEAAGQHPILRIWPVTLAGKLVRELDNSYSTYWPVLSVKHLYG
jgi:hypothetical protein